MHECESETTCDNCGEVELVGGTFVSDKGDLIVSGKFCSVCEMFEFTDNFIHDDFEEQYAKREDLVEAVKNEYIPLTHVSIVENAKESICHIIRTHELKPKEDSDFDKEVEDDLGLDLKAEEEE